MAGDNEDKNLNALQLQLILGKLLKKLLWFVLAMCLTNRFHFAVRLYSDNAQMTSKHGKNNEVRYEP